MSSNYGARYYQKLKDLSQSQGLDMQSLLRIYAQQRLLYRLSVSDSSAQFCLKGGLMLAAWNGGDLLRPTDDIDLNGFGIGGIEEIEDAIRAAIAVDVPDDGVVFDPTMLKVKKERGEGIIPGGKVMIQCRVHTARVQISVDVGFGNVITPYAAEMDIPTILSEFVPQPRIAGYPLETIIAEKLHAIAQHGMMNTRLKDYYDIWRVQGTHEFESDLLAQAIGATFEQQERILRADMPGLSDMFAQKNERDWRAFMKKTIFQEAVTLGEVIVEVRAFVVPVIETALTGEGSMLWTPDDGWTEREFSLVRSM